MIRQMWCLLKVLVAGGTLAIIGIGLVVSGLIPIKASSGHWPITRWFLEFSMQRGFSTQSLGIEVPPLDDPALILRGATQYELTCSPCHGSPRLRAPRVAAAMTPTPPYLASVISHWDAAELFTIVKHGIKFTGMPAWPTKNRDDEVWAMVAFLQRLPALDAGEYEQLASGDPALTGCARCHGRDGFPKLAGQNEAYLYNSLRAFQAGRRHSGIMEPVAAGLSDAQMRKMAAHYANLPRARAASPAAPERGREIAHRGIPLQKVPACADCHGPSQPQPRSDYPTLAGQYADYLVLQLELFARGHRGGTAYAHLMQEVAPKLTTQQMRDVAAYYESLR